MGNDEVDWEKCIISVLEGLQSSKDESTRRIKKLRKLVLLSLQMEESDKKAKKQFKKVIQAMEQEGSLHLDADGTINLLIKKKKHKSKSKDVEGNKKKRKSLNDEKMNKKKRNTKELVDDVAAGNDQNEYTKEKEKTDEENHEDGEAESDNHEKTNISATKNKPCKGNPQGITRLFLGNLPFAVDEASLAAFLPGEVTHIKWITDKETGKFYGSAFVEMDSSASAAEAVALAGSKLIGRPIKISFAPARDGDVWPPAKKVVSGDGTGGGQAGGKGIKALSAKPENCTKLFIGNLSYEIDDEGITKFFGSVDAEVKAVRWLHHRDTGDFKGVGFVEFWNTEACEKAAMLNGKNLLGRPIRIDWTD